MELLDYKISNESSIDLDRINRLRRKMQSREANICSERALIYTKSFRNSEGESYILRKAKAFANTLDEMTIYLEQDSIIFGNQASNNFGAPIFPEYSIDWVIDELDEFELREGDRFTISDQVKKDLISIHSYWKGATHQDEVARTSPEILNQAVKQKVLHRGGISMSGDGHIVPDHEYILKRGFRGIIQDVIQQREKTTDAKRIEFYNAVEITLEASLRWIKRYGKMAEKNIGLTCDPKRDKELIEISNMCETLMEKPAQSFYEGVQTVYLTHVLHMIESNGHSFCYGRFDQYMLELYEQDLKNNVIDKDKALEIITHMFLMNSSNNKIRPYGHTKFSQGYPLYSNLMVGGRKPDGVDGTNDLSYLSIEAMNLTAMAEPNFSMRYNGDTPDSLMKLATKLIKTGCGMPSMFNDDVAVRGLLDLGVTQEDALDYCAIGCVETGVPGKYGHRATGMTYVNWGKLVELLLHNGFDPDSNIQLVSINGENNSNINYQNYEELWQGWLKLLEFYSDLAVLSDDVCDESLIKYDASPFASAFIDNCLELGKTIKEGGCKYDIISQSNIGPSIVGNSLVSLKKLVFDNKQVSLEEMLAGMKNNWQGEHEALHDLIMEQPKFGNDNDEVDEIVADVFNSYLDLLPKYKTIRTGKGPLVSRYTMSTSNITSYVPSGKSVGATPDGRYQGSPLNEGCSPTQGTDTNGPTAVIKSVSKLPNHMVAAGQLLNMRFSPDSISTSEKEDKFIGFLQASRKLGIYHNQFNIVDTAILEDAMVNPKDHLNLIVRVAGYCAQFVSLMPEAQQAIIERTVNNL